MDYIYRVAILALCLFEGASSGFDPGARVAYSSLCNLAIEESAHRLRGAQANRRLLEALSPEGTAYSEDHRFRIVPDGINTVMRRTKPMEERDFYTTSFGWPSLYWSLLAKFNSFVREEQLPQLPGVEQKVGVLVDRLVVVDRGLSSPNSGTSQIWFGAKEIREAFLAPLAEVVEGRRFTLRSSPLSSGAERALTRRTVLSVAAGLAAVLFYYVDKTGPPAGLIDWIVTGSPVYLPVSTYAYTYYTYDLFRDSAKLVENMRNGIRTALREGNKDTLLHWGITKVSDEGIPTSMLDLVFRWDSYFDDFTLFLNVLNDEVLLERSWNGTWKPVRGPAIFDEKQKK